MKILVLSNNDVGLYKFRKELIQELIKQNNTVYICLPEGEFIESLKKLGCKYIPCNYLERRGTNPFKDIKLIHFYRRIVNEYVPDVVLTYTIKPNIYGGLVCRMNRVPYIVNVTGLGTSIENGGLLSFITCTLYKTGIRNAECVFFQNSANQRVFVERKIVKGKTVLIPGSGVNLEVHKFEEYPQEENEIRFLFIGRIMKDKGIEELLSAIKQLRVCNPKVLLDIVGGYDEDYSQQIRAAEKEGIVKYYGQQSSVHEFIKKAHCVVLPSYHEGMANVLLEAASTGRPVIASKIPGCAETFDEGTSGIGCEVKNTDSLVEAMASFVSLPLEDKKAMGRAGRIKIEKEFDRNIVIQAYTNELKQIRNR